MNRVLAVPVFVAISAIAPVPALAEQDPVLCAARPMEPAVSSSVLINRIAALFPTTLAPAADGRVTRAQDGAVTISLGGKDGLVPGDSVSALREEQEIRNPRTGASLGKVETTIGHILVDEVFSAYANGRVIQGLADVRAGDRARIRVRGGKIELAVIPLIEDVQDPLAEAALLRLVEDLNTTRRFQISMGEVLAAALLQEGLQRHQILEGRGLARAAQRFKIEHVLVVYVRSIEGRPYVDVRAFSFPTGPARLRFFGVRPPCTTITGDVMSQAQFDSSYRACERGEAHACSDLGALYEQSAGGVQARTWYGNFLGLSAELYRLGCDGGDATGCSNLAAMYQQGRGVSKGPGRAAASYGRGCDLGDARACAQLAQMHESGTSLSADAKRVRDLYRRACDLGALEVCGP